MRLAGGVVESDCNSKMKGVRGEKRTMHFLSHVKRSGHQRIFTHVQAQEYRRRKSTNLAKDKLETAWLSFFIWSRLSICIPRSSLIK